MSFCTEEAYAVAEQRKGRDENPRIVEVTIPGAAYHVYYRADNFIRNTCCSSIPPFVGHPSFAPQEFYGPGTHRTDHELTGFMEK